MTLDLVKIRRDLHQIPEIGLEEFKTQAYLLERIAEITEGKRVRRAADLADGDPGFSERIQSRKDHWLEDGYRWTAHYRANWP